MTRSAAFFAILAVILISQAASASEWFTPLSDKEIAAQAVFTGLTLMDWNQTIEIAKHPEKYTETNPVLGDHPTAGRVNTVMSLGIITHAVITWALPSYYRAYWQYIWIGIEAEAVHSNWRSGISISF